MRETNRLRAVRLLLGATVAVTATAGATSCDPDAARGGLDSAAVSLATDQAGTEALERGGIDVQWLSCTAQLADRDGGSTAKSDDREAKETKEAKEAKAAKGAESAEVDCQGETRNRKELAIKGRVTEERDGRCVRGDLVATSGDRTLFRARTLGDCDAKPSATRSGTAPSGTPTPSSSRTTSRPTVTETVRPSPSEPAGKPPVTVTVTSTPSEAPSGTPGKSGAEEDSPPDHKVMGADR